MEMCELCGQPLPTINIDVGNRFVVDLSIGMASNYGWIVAPPYAFSGAIVEQIVAKAEVADSRLAYTPDDWTGASMLAQAVEQAVENADPIAVALVKESGRFVIVAPEQGEPQKFDCRFWRALSVLSDCVYLDRDPCRPAMFLRDDTIIGMVMGVRTW